MSAERRNKDKAMASYMKERGITRTSAQCPMSCGRPLNLVNGVLNHVGTCAGRRKAVRPNALVPPRPTFRAMSLSQAVAAATAAGVDEEGRRRVGLLSLERELYAA